MAKSSTGATKLPGVMTAGQMFFIDPAKLIIHKNYNVRDTFDPDLRPRDATLYNSIMLNGFQSDKPVVVRLIGDKFVLVAGHRRVDAALRARNVGKKTIPTITAILEGRNADGSERTDAQRTADLIHSNDGEPLSGPEKGAAFLRLRAAEWSDKQIAAEFGVTPKWVVEMCKMAKLDPRLKALVAAGVLSLTLAIETQTTHGANAPVILAAAQSVTAQTGKRKNKITQTSITKATGLGGKNLKGHKSGTSTPMKGPGAPPPVGDRPTLVARPAIPETGLKGPFTRGTDMDDCAILNGDPAKTPLCDMADVQTAVEFLTYVNQGWQVFHGRKAAGVPTTVMPKVEPVVADDANKRRKSTGRTARK